MKRLQRAYPRHKINIDKKSFQLAWGMIFNGTAQEGENIPLFEKKFADYIGAKYAVGVGSARKGLFLILKSLNLGEGAEIIMPAYTFHALPMAVLANGYRPVFVDVNPRTYNIEPSLIEAKISPNTKAIVLTHMFGQPCDMTPIVAISKKHGLFLVEDCAHACGATYHQQRTGSFGDAAIFSFKMGKNLPCFGGGMIIVNNDNIYRKLRAALEGAPLPTRKNLLKEIVGTSIFHLTTQRTFFSFVTYPLIRLMDLLRFDWIDREIEEKADVEKDVIALSRTSRISNLQSRVGIEQLSKLDTVNSKRNENAQIFLKELVKAKSIKLQEAIPDSKATYLYFRIRVRHAGEFRKRLLRRGVDSKRDDMSVCSSLEAFNPYRSACPAAESIPAESIEIPCNPSLTKDDLVYIARQVKAVADEI